MHTRGFSLAEMLITVGVLSILLGIGTISFATIRVNNQVDLVAAEVKAALLRARSEALNRYESGVYFESDRFVYFVGETYVEGDPTNIETVLPATITFATITFDDSIATFDPVTGYLEEYEDPSEVIIAGGDNTHAVSINEWGIVSIQ